MCLGQHITHDPDGFTRVDQIIDHQHTLAAICARNDAIDAFEHLQLSLSGVAVVACDTDRIDEFDFKLTCNDRRRHEPATGDAND